MLVLVTTITLVLELELDEVDETLGELVEEVLDVDGDEVEVEMTVVELVEMLLLDVLVEELVDGTVITETDVLTEVELVDGTVVTERAELEVVVTELDELTELYVTDGVCPAGVTW